MADDQTDRNGNQRRNRHRRRGVLQMLQSADPQPHRAHPITRSEQIGQRLREEVHREPPTTGAVGSRRLRRDTRSQGVASRPANISNTSMTIASTKMATIPATIWSLLFAW